MTRHSGGGLSPGCIAEFARRSPAPNSVRAASLGGPPGRDGLRCAAGAGVRGRGDGLEGTWGKGSHPPPPVPRKMGLRSDGRTAGRVPERLAHPWRGSTCGAWPGCCGDTQCRAQTGARFRAWLAEPPGECRSVSRIPGMIQAAARVPEGPHFHHPRYGPRLTSARANRRSVLGCWPPRHPADSSQLTADCWPLIAECRTSSPEG